MGLVSHAEFELKRAGLFDKDSDYGGELATCLVEMVKKFASFGHSGGSAAISIALLTKLLKFETLTPITSNPDEWMCVTEHSGPAGPAWQSMRQSNIFSEDGGKTWYCLDDPEKKNWPKRCSD